MYVHVYVEICEYASVFASVCVHLIVPSRAKYLEYVTASDAPDYIHANPEQRLLVKQ
jgi:hypothetical protein